MSLPADTGIMAGRWFRWGFAAAALALGGGGILQWRRIHIPADRVYTIGWEHSPPYQVARPGSEPTGFAIEIIREAARRRGVRLKWVNLPGQSESSLASRRVDLWPLITVTDRRKRLLYFSDAYLDREYGLLVRLDSHFREASDLRGHRVTSNSISINGDLLHTHFPGVGYEPSATLNDAIRRTCAGEFDATFGPQFPILETLVERRLCGEVPMRMLPTVGLRVESAVGSTFEAAPAAEALRDAIGDMAEDGSAERIISAWSSGTNQVMSLQQAHRARRMAHQYRWAVIGAGIICLLAIWAAAGYRRARNRATAESAARERAERNLRLLASSMSEMVLAYGMDRRLRYANPGAEQLSGYSRDQIAAREPGFWAHEEDRADVSARWEKAFAGEPPSVFTYRLKTQSGDDRWVSATVTPTRDEKGRQIGVQTIEQDITQRRRDEMERAALEHQLAQSQKLESVGRLAGGVAHDFNNLLTVIGGFAYLVQQDVKDPGTREHIEQIIDASGRAADLTRQLLTFSRRQVAAPEVLDLNTVIEQTTKMIRRLVGEDVEVTLTLDPHLHPVMAPPGQIVQVLMNLAANARDAILAGGTIHIETTNAVLTDEYASSHAEVTPGDYALLTVTDSGIGMEESTLSRIFEPFFTTKALGSGTGLGLASVYGIVKQAGGHIWVYSEPGKGTSFKIYLPRTAKAGETAANSRSAAVPAGGSETVFLVEDQAKVRQLAAEVLTSLGYKVLEASSGEDALRKQVEHAGTIDLLITDVIMPGMNGRELAGEFARVRPATKVLYMSGYSDNVVEQRGALEPDVNYLGKPFSPSELAAKVRQVLDA